MKKTTGILLAFTCFFAGACLGFLLSPVKHGIGNNSGNNCGNQAYNYGHEEEDAE